MTTKTSTTFAPGDVVRRKDPDASELGEVTSAGSADTLIDVQWPSEDYPRTVSGDQLVLIRTAAQQREFQERSRDRIMLATWRIAQENACHAAGSWRELGDQLHDRCADLATHRPALPSTDPARAYCAEHVPPGVRPESVAAQLTVIRQYAYDLAEIYRRAAEGQQAGIDALARRYACAPEDLPAVLDSLLAAEQ